MEQLIPSWIIQQYSQSVSNGSFDAATMFVDLSGFSSLTESLLRHELKESETLAAIMSAVFTPLVDTIYEFGGLITGFSGDAFTALFIGAATDMMPIATAAAVSMSERFEDSHTQTKRTGDVEFALKIGLGFGSVIWKIIESSDQKKAMYCFGGPGIEQSVQAQQRALPKQIVIPQGCLETFDTDIQIEPIDEDFVAIKHYALSSLPETFLLNEEIDQHIAQQLIDPTIWQLTNRGEFRYVTAVLVNLQTTVESEKLDDAIRYMFDLQEKHGGHLNSINVDDKGCTVILFWGAPSTMENDALHATRFAQNLRDTLGDQVRIGMTSQWVYAGFIGTQKRSEYSCYGTSINLAARMMIKADWGEVWLDQQTQQLVDLSFNTEPQLPSIFKGFEYPIDTFLLKSSKQHAHTIYRGKMVSRIAELELLHTYITPLDSGLFAGSILVVGEAGLGKSRLVHEFEQQTQTYSTPIRWLLAQTDEIVQQSLNPWRYLVRSYFEQSPEGDEHQNKLAFERIFNTLLTKTYDENIRQELQRTYSFLGALAGLYWNDSLYARVETHLRLPNLIAAVKALIRAESQDQPVIIHLEDAHWLDEDSLALLRELTRNIIDIPFAIVMTTRPIDFTEQLKPSSDELKLIQLNPISHQQAAELASSLLNQDVSETLGAFLVNRSEGNPFFIEQLTFFLSERELFTSTTPLELVSEAAAAASLPTNVQNILIARIDRLSNTVRLVVQTAAILGREWPIRVLTHMLSSEKDVFENIQTAESAEIWMALNELRYLFKHALLRDAAYSMQLRAKLRSLHIAAAEAIQAVYGNDLAPHYIDLVHHYRLAEDLDNERVWAYKAGSYALSLYANDEALRFLSRALELTPLEATEERINILLTRESAYDILGDRDNQLQDIKAALALISNDTPSETRIKLLFLQAQYAHRMGENAAILPYTQQALGLVTATNHVDSELQLEILHLHMLTVARIDNPEKAFGYLDQALMLARKAGLRKWEALFLYTSVRLETRSIEAFQGRSKQVDALYEAAQIYEELDDQLGLAEVYNRFGVYYDEQGDYLKAIESFTKSEQAYREVGYIWRQTAALNNLGLAYLFLGDYVQASEYYEKSLNMAYESGHRHSICITLINLGLLSHLTGNQQTGTQYCQAAVSMAQESNDKMLQGYALTYLAHCLLAQGNWSEAEDAYFKALTIRREMQHKVLEFETAAGLARLEVGRANYTLALAYVEPIIAHLKSGTLDGAEEPFRIWWTCIQVLALLEDSRYAELSDAAYQQLQQQSQRIQDVDLRQNFLERIPVHRMIRDVWQQRHNHAGS